jgi:hypothetical protein
MLDSQRGQTCFKACTSSITMSGSKGDRDPSSQLRCPARCEGPLSPKDSTFPVRRQVSNRALFVQHCGSPASTSPSTLTSSSATILLHTHCPLATSRASSKRPRRRSLGCSSPTRRTRERHRAAWCPKADTLDLQRSLSIAGVSRQRDADRPSIVRRRRERRAARCCPCSSRLRLEVAKVGNEKEISLEGGDVGL